jgi:tRNA A37 threonylcarbamoyladenosine synthetase subunit TsaC/SUA5/YrdC
LVIDGGFCGMEPTSVVSLIADTPEILRHGKEDTAEMVD